MLDINPVPHPINNVALEDKVCKTLSLTGTKVRLGDLDVCRRMKKKDQVIIKFKNRKQRNVVIFKQKLMSKGDDLVELQFSRSLLINDSTCFENQVVFNKCCCVGKIGPVKLRLLSLFFLGNNLLSLNLPGN